MRVAQVLLSSTGGIGTHVADLAGRLIALGHDVRVVADAPTLRHFAMPGPVGVPTRPVGVPTRLVAGMRAVRATLAGADVVHAHGYRAALLAAALTPRTTPLVVSLHNQLRGGRGPRRAAGTRLSRWVMRRADLVTGASADLADLARSLGAGRTEVAQVPSPRVAGLLATDPLPPGERAAEAARVLRKAGLDAPPPLVLAVARVAPQKDLTTLVDAAASCRHPATWVVVGGGDPDLAAGLAARAARIRAPLHLVGPQEHVEPWLQAAAVLVVTSEWEARALVVQEAMAAGTPVVATGTGGLPELVAGVGTLVPVGDPHAVAEAVAAVVADEEGTARLTRAARARAAGWDDPDEGAARWLVRYGRLLP